MESRRKYGRKHGCKIPIPIYKMNLYRIGFKRSIHDKINIVSMGMNARFKVDSHFSNTQLLIYCSQLRMFRVWKFNSRNTRRLWPMKIFGFTQIKEGICSTHRGILETYTTTFNSKYHQLKSRAWLAKSENRIYQMVLCIMECTPGFENMQEWSGNNPPKDLADLKGSNVSNGTQPEKERMQGIQL